MSFNQQSLVSYGLSQSLINVFPFPIVSKRTPTTADKAPLGSLWVVPASNAAYVLTSIVNNSATWVNVEGGAGVFSSLTVTPGPISLTGTTTINTTGAATTSIGSVNGASGITLLVGTGNFSLDGAAGSTYAIGASTVGGTISIGGSAQTGNFTLAPSTAALTIAIGNGNGAKAINIGNGISGNTISVGNGANTSAQIINLAAGASGADSTVNVLSGNGTAGAQTFNLFIGTRAGQANIGTGAAAHVVNIGSSTAGNITNLSSAVTSLPGPVYVYTGAGAPDNGLALHVGDLYINTTAASDVTRMYIATAAGAWTNVTCAA